MEGLSEGEGVGGEVSTISSTNRTSYDVPMTHVMLTIHGEVTTPTCNAFVQKVLDMSPDLTASSSTANVSR